MQPRSRPRERLLMDKSNKTLDRFWDMPLGELLKVLEATPTGLTSSEAKQRLRLHGPNSLAGESRFAALIAFSAFLRQSAGPDSPRGQRHLDRTARCGRRLDHHRDRPAQRDRELLRGVSGAARGGGYSEAGCHHCRGFARWTTSVELPVAELVPGDIVKLNCRRPGAGRCPFIGRQGSARARVRAHRGVPARR